MPQRRKSPAPAQPSELVWERSEPAQRPAPGPLSRERIVRAAIAIADKEGLAEVSLRKVAAKLNAGPMRLYTYTSTKEGLLELMVDAVYGEIAVKDLASGDWRGTLRSIAEHTRQAAKKHPWFVDLLGRRPHLGPHALEHYEQSLAALCNQSAFEHIDDALQAYRTVTAYVVGAIKTETASLRAEHESGLNEGDFQAASWPYLQRMIETGRFPMIAKVVSDATHPSSDVTFERGLESVIEGIALGLAGPRGPNRRKPRAHD
ncbi:MAG TPA: TetR/AcrR family transcriptional regulator C-terminal domain-containing protein [Polyangiaceae bacterium]|nr:TetR/AcrR family transcriptional regulator C-terminal domain-containing protein [Polyangiaceae bacterium]